MRWLWAGAFAVMGLSAEAQTDIPAALEAARLLDEAGVALAEASGATDRTRALTQTVQAYERGLEALRQGVREATVREQVISRSLQNKEARLAKLLAVLQTLERAPEPLLMLHPEGPLGNARSGMILADITPALRAEADALKAVMEELIFVRKIQETAAETLQEGLEGAQAARVALATAIAERTDRPKRFDADPEQMRLLLESADTLSGFAVGLAGLDAAATADDDLSFSGVKGQLGLPVRGRLLRGYEEADAAGIARPGVLIAATERALVTTPWPATIRFLGPLLDYGNVIILEPEAGVLLVLAGMEAVYGEVGDILPGGAAVGLMGGDGIAAPLTQTITDGGVTRRETLYMEVRRDSVPEDPAPWFRDLKDRL